MPLKWKDRMQHLECARHYVLKFSVPLGVLVVGGLIWNRWGEEGSLSLESPPPSLLCLLVDRAQCSAAMAGVVTRKPRVALEDR